VVRLEKRVEKEAEEEVNKKSSEEDGVEGEARTLAARQKDLWIALDAVLTYLEVEMVACRFAG